MIKILVAIIVAVLVFLTGMTWLTLHWTYSDGERAGFVQKLSRKGWPCKTWEGEMAIVTMPGTVAEKFYFTVPDDAVASEINVSVGKRVALHYEQHKWVPAPVSATRNSSLPVCARWSERARCAKFH